MENKIRQNKLSINNNFFLLVDSVGTRLRKKETEKLKISPVANCEKLWHAIHI